MPPADPQAAGRRRAVLLSTTVVVLLAAVFAAKLVTMQVGQLLGERAWRSGDAVAAERHFATSGRFNLVQRWIAPFNRGVASYGQREWDQAARWFERSFAIAPESARCHVALNWTWSLEALGDELAQGGHDAEAAQRWSQAESVLAQASGCDDGRSSRQPEPEPQPSDEPADGRDESDRTAGSERDQREATQQRIEEKTRGNRPEDQPEEEAPAAPDKAEQLADRNREAARIRQRDSDRSGEGSSDGPRRTW